MNGEEAYQHLKALRKDERERLLQVIWWSYEDVESPLMSGSWPEGFTEDLLADVDAMTWLMGRALDRADSDNTDEINAAIDEVLEEYRQEQGAL